MEKCSSNTWRIPWHGASDSEQKAVSAILMRQQSIRIPDGLLRPKENTLVVFDLKNVDPTTGMHLSNEPVFN